VQPLDIQANLSQQASLSQKGLQVFPGNGGRRIEEY
jgi:hypothetical protein